MSYQQYFTAEHDMIREATRKFVTKEIMPHIDEWGRRGDVPA